MYSHGVPAILTHKHFLEPVFLRRHNNRVDFVWVQNNRGNSVSRDRLSDHIF